MHHSVRNRFTSEKYVSMSLQANSRVRTAESSANLTVKFPEVVAVQLFVYSVYSNGELVHPWGAPVFVVKEREWVRLTRASCDLPVRKERYHLWMKGMTFIAFIFSSNTWG